MGTQNTPLTKEQEFEKAAKPLIEYLNANCHPHMTIIVTCNHAELLDGQMSVQK